MMGKYLPLSGSDHFQLLLDHRMRKAGQAGNISRIRYHLSSGTDLNGLRKDLIENSVLNNILKVRYRLPLFRIPAWTTSYGLPEKAVILHQGNLNEQSESDLLNSIINTDNGLVRMDLYTTMRSEPCLLISMHHVLFDHRGMINFIQALNGKQITPFIAEVKPRPFIRSLKSTFTVSRFAFRSSGPDLISILPKRPTKQPVSNYLHIRFDTTETDRILANAIDAGAVLSKSVFYMAATMLAVQHVATKNGNKGKFSWMAAPHDMRPKGTPGHLIGNDISFMFFRLEKDDNADIHTSVQQLQKQLKNQIRKRIPAKQSDFLQLFRAVPFWAYQAMTDLASSGKVASMAFSDLGEDPSVAGRILNAQIQQATYFPPVPIPPGLSVVFCKEHGALNITLGTIDGLLTIEDQEILRSEIRRMLLNET